MTPDLAYAALGLVSGFLVGLAHFASLRRLTALYLEGRAPKQAVALQLLRLALVALVLFGLVQLGALPLLAGALGLVLGREVVVRRARRES